VTIAVYLDDGRVFEYDIGDDPHKAREHCDAIGKNGYRHNDAKVFEFYPAHRILKVKVEGTVPTKYPDRSRGT